jgi:predicted glycoside hydrolase/deacetylase ChbG (UPF0249 family)
LIWAAFEFMKQLVVNADDFGMSESINLGILDSHLRGIVTSATILANGAAFEGAVEIAKATPQLGVGVHLNLTQGFPVSDSSKISSLTNREGELFRTPGGLLRSVMTGKLRSADVEHEFAAQIEKVRAAGIAITHLDGHKHIHMLPKIFPIVVDLAKRNRIPCVRLASERGGSFMSVGGKGIRAKVSIAKQYARSRGLTMIARNSAGLARRAGLRFPSHFHGISQTGFLDGKLLSALLHNMPDGTNELMCHPGRLDPALDKKLTRLRESRQRELEALTSVEITNLVARLGIKLISFRELGMV